MLIDNTPVLLTDSSPIAVHWHLPEPEWHEATVELRDLTSPSGLDIREWHLDGATAGGVFAPSWSSGRRRRGAGMAVRARIRVERHDGPRLLRVCLIDSSGARHIETYRFEKRVDSGQPVDFGELNDFGEAADVGKAADFGEAADDGDAADCAEPVILGETVDERVSRNRR